MTTCRQSLGQYCNNRRAGVAILISEKVAVPLTFRSVPIDSGGAGRLARLLARCARPLVGARGLSVPEKMQYVLDQLAGHAWSPPLPPPH